MTTNFQNITESPETLAEFLSAIGHRCLDFVLLYIGKPRTTKAEAADCSRCPLANIDCWNSDKIIEWLQEEYDAE